jgi:hypothetical protein
MVVNGVARSGLLVPMLALTCGLATLAPGEVRAQFAAFELTRAPFSFTTILPSGASSRHEIVLRIARDGRVTGSGRRYDTTARGIAPGPVAGTRVSVLSASRLARPIKDESTVNGPGSRQRERSCPIGIFLSDGAVFKGVIWRVDTRDDFGSGFATSSKVGSVGAATFRGVSSGQVAWDLLIGGGGGASASAGVGGGAGDAGFGGGGVGSVTSNPQ